MTMKLLIYQVDAFADRIFSGNPAAVCPLVEWLEDEMLQKIAAENNLSETVFYVPKGNVFEIRWFTPTVEVDLCGHATLAAAFVLHRYGNYTKRRIDFYSPRSGSLPVEISNDHYVLNFPADQVVEIPLTDDLLSATDKMPLAAYQGKTDYMLVFENENDIASLHPNLSVIARIKARGVIVTAAGDDYDFVSRFFAPAVGIDEDPVCGSAHTTLTPYWANQLNKRELRAYQLSKRGGELRCNVSDGRVELGGRAVLYMKGELFIKE